MSCGVMHQDTYFTTKSWLSRSKKSGSVERLDLVTPPEFHLGPHHTTTPSEPPMMTLEDLHSQYNSCYTCGVNWSVNHVSLDCRECGGYSLERPCPRCDGKCCNSWTRDISSTHNIGKAQWEGECGLATHQQTSASHFLSKDALEQGLANLSTSA